MDNTLPKIIHQLWVGPPLPLHIYQMMQTWKEHHPTWEVKLWTEAPPLVNQDLWDNAEKISPKAPEQFRSDVARYEILYHDGGIWADADFVCQRPFDALARRNLRRPGDPTMVEQRSHRLASRP